MERFCIFLTTVFIVDLRSRISRLCHTQRVLKQLSYILEKLILLSDC